MSSFSSVIRKPGQKIVPKAAPRRNVQRRIQQPAIVTGDTLTPESTPRESASQVAQSSQDARQVLSDTSLIAGSAPTPPPTSPSQPSGDDRTNPSRALTPERRSRVAISSPDARRESTVPVVATTVPSPDARQGQPNEPVEEGAAPRNIPTAGTGLIPQHGPPSAKRRKITLPETGTTIDVPSLPQSAARAKVRRPSAGQQTASSMTGTDADLLNVSSQFRAVSELANSIETRTRTSRSRTGQRSTAESDSDYEALDPQLLRGRSTASRSAAIEEAAAAVVARAVRGSKQGRARHRRGHTPEDAENHQINTEQTAMADLVNDSGLGKRSNTGKRLEDEWEDIKARWDQKLEQNRANAKKKASLRKAARATQIAANIEGGEDDEHAVDQPVMTLVGGNIVVAEESRFVDFSHNATEAAVNIDESLIRSDEPIYNYVNQNRIGKHAGLRNATKWTAELTDKLYQGLRVFGTDFELIASLFGDGWTRRQIKAKFVREEKQNLIKVKEALADRERIDLNGYVSMTDGVLGSFRDPKEIEAELEAEEKKIREEWEKAKRGDHFADDEADQPLESIETDHPADGDVARASTTPGLEANPFNEMAQRVVRRAAQPRKKQPQKQREQTGTSRTSNAGRKGTRGKKPLEGVEERIGNVGDVEL